MLQFLTDRMARMGLAEKMASKKSSSYPLPRNLVTSCLAKDNVGKMQQWISQHFESDEFEQAKILYAAVDNGALECVEWLLNSKVHPDSFKDGRGRTALLIAARTNQADVLKMLLDFGADMNHVDSKGVNAVILSARHQHLACLNILIKRGAFLDGHAEFYQHTALTEAAASGMLKSVQMLLDGGAGIDIEKSESETALMLASEIGQLDVVRELLKRGANVFKESSVEAEQKTALFYAIYGKHHEIVKCILQYDDRLSKTDANGFTPLAAAICSGDALTVEVLLDMGANLSDITDLASVTRQCAGNGGEVCLELLLNYSDDLKNIMSATLFEAVCGDHLKCVKLLVKHGADLSVRNYRSSTLLHEAAQNGANRCVKFLLEQGIGVNVKDENGQSAIFDAASRGEPDCLITLISHGADVNERNDKRMTPAMVAFSSDVFRILFRHGIDIHAQDEKGMTPLMYICNESVIDHEEVIKALLDRGADINQTDFQGRTALMFGAINGQPKCIQLLLAKGADISIRDHTGSTVLDHSLQLSTEYNPVLYAASKKNVKSLLNHIQADSVDAECMIQQALAFLLLYKFRNAGEKMRGFVEQFFKFKDKFPCVINWCSDKFAEIAEMGEKKTIHFLMLKGVRPRSGPNGRFCLPLIDASVLKYFLINNLISYSEIKEQHSISLNYRIPPVIRPAEDEEDDDIFTATSAPSFQEEVSSEISPFQVLTSQPWPLVKLCLQAVSTSLSSTKDKTAYIQHSGLPPKLVRFLIHENDSVKLCPSQWDHIPIVAEPGAYEDLPRPRPLLDHWPVGRQLEKCDCEQCRRKGLRFSGVKVAKLVRNESYEDWAMFLEEMELFSVSSDDDEDHKRRLQDLEICDSDDNCNLDGDDSLDHISEGEMRMIEGEMRRIGNPFIL